MSGIDQVIEHMNSIYESTLRSGDSVVAKRQLLDLYFAAAPSVLTVDAQLKPAMFESVAGEWLLTDDSVCDTRILYLHGGSWMAGSPSSHRSVTSRIACDTGCAVLSIAYRLAPEHPFPAGLEDCLSAFRLIIDNGPHGPAKAKKIFVMGDSAGGNLALGLLQTLKSTSSRLPDAVVALSPPTDMCMNSPSIWLNKDIDPIINAYLLPMIVNNYLQDRAPKEDPRVSPIYGDLSGLPPILLQTGKREILLDDSVRFAEAVHAKGGVVELDLWDDMPHVFQGFAPILPEATRALKKVAAFLRQIS